MWAEDDLGASAAPCLQSLIEPSDGKVYTMYHGTSKGAAARILKEGFRQSAVGMLGRGVYLSRDLEKASRYPLELHKHQRVVIRVRVNVGKVKKIDSQTHPMRTTWHDHGYDTAWCPPNCGMVSSGLEEDCVWDPKRITVIDVISSCLQDLRRHHGVLEPHKMLAGAAERIKIKNDMTSQLWSTMLGQTASSDPLHLYRILANDMALSIMDSGLKGRNRRYK